MDNYVIKELKRKYDLTKDEDVLALYAKLQSGEYDLSGTEGRRFDDEVYELAMQARERQRQNRSGSKKKITRSSGKQDKKKSRRKVVVLTRASGKKDSDCSAGGGSHVLSGIFRNLLL